MDQFEVINVVGEGAYGTVLKCRDKKTGKFVAIKKFKESEEDEIVRKTTMREVKILRTLKHDNVVKLLQVFRKRGKLYLVFEYMEQNMLELLDQHADGLDPELVRLLIYQLCMALHYCHSSHVLHRDIKPENLLVCLEPDVQLKLCDFGFARFVPLDENGHGKDLTDYVATRWYRSPELLLGTSDYGPPADMWAVACIMCELLDGQPLFPGDSELDQLHLIRQCLGDLTPTQMEVYHATPRFHGHAMPPVDTSKLHSIERRYLGKVNRDGLLFLKSILRMDPADRLSGKQSLMHPYFKPFHKDLQVPSFPILHGAKSYSVLSYSALSNVPSDVSINDTDVTVDDSRGSISSRSQTSSTFSSTYSRNTSATEVSVSTSEDEGELEEEDVIDADGKGDSDRESELSYRDAFEDDSDITDVDDVQTSETSTPEGGAPREDNVPEKEFGQSGTTSQVEHVMFTSDSTNHPGKRRASRQADTPKRSQAAPAPSQQKNPTHVAPSSPRSRQGSRPTSKDANAFDSSILAIRRLDCHSGLPSVDKEKSRKSSSKALPSVRKSPVKRKDSTPKRMRGSVVKTLLRNQPRGSKSSSSSHQSNRDSRGSVKLPQLAGAMRINGMTMAADERSSPSPTRQYEYADTRSKTITNTSSNQVSSTRRGRKYSQQSKVTPATKYTPSSRASKPGGTYTFGEGRQSPDVHQRSLAYNAHQYTSTSLQNNYRDNIRTMAYPSPKNHKPHSRQNSLHHGFGGPSRSMFESRHAAPNTDSMKRLLPMGLKLYSKAGGAPPRHRRY